MKTLAFKSLIFSLLMVFSCSLAFAEDENKFIYDTKYDGEKVISKTVYENVSQQLIPKTKFEYNYDKQGRIMEKIAYKWDSKYEKWINNYHMICNYDNAGNVTIEYAQWDIKSKSFNQNPQHQECRIEDVLNIIA